MEKQKVRITIKRLGRHVAKVKGKESCQSEAEAASME